MNFHARLGRLEAAKMVDQKLNLPPDLWPLIGSPYTQEDFIEMLAREADANKKGSIDGHA